MIKGLPQPEKSLPGTCEELIRLVDATDLLLTQIEATDSDALAQTVARVREFMSRRGRLPQRVKRSNSSGQENQNKLRRRLSNYQRRLQAQGLWEELTEPPPAGIDELPEAVATLVAHDSAFTVQAIPSVTRPREGLLSTTSDLAYLEGTG